MCFRRHFIVGFLCLFIASLTIGVARQPLYAASANLVWKPYLQEVTDTSVAIQWTTRTGALSTVRYATDTSYATAANAIPRPIAALGTSMHRVSLTGLQPNTRYYYKVYTDDEDLLPEQTLSFRTAPGRGSSTPFTFLAFGDFGKNTDSQKRLRDQMARESFEFLVTTGDNAYNTGLYTEFDTNVFQIYGDIFSKAAIFPTLGNHDYATSGGAPYLDLFSLPRNAWRSADQERYYSFDYGNVHVVALDTNTPLNAIDSDASDDMFDWLRDDLSRTTQPWVIAVVHHSPYSTGGHGSDSRAQTKLVPIFEQYGVDLVLTGHDHLYQRTKPLRGGQVTTVDQGGIVYVVTGAGSAADYGCTSAAWLVVAYCSKSYGLYTRVHVDDDHLTVEAIDDAGIVHDSFGLSQTSPVSGIALPGRFEVEDYRSGGAGVGYVDSTSGNSGGVYRSDDVDIQSCADGTPCYNVAWITAGEWLAYDVAVASGGTYTIALRVATPNSGRQVHLEVDGVNVSGAMPLPNTGSWQSWTTVLSAPIPLSSGPHTLRIVADTSGLNLNYVVVSAANPPSPTPTNTALPTDTPTATNTGVPTDSPASTPTATNTGVPTDSPASTPTATNTGVPTDSPPSTPTDTPFPTSAPTDTSEPVPTTTSAPTSTPTDTGVPTSTPTSTPTPTRTAMPTSSPSSTPGAATTLTFTTNADARVEEANPNTNYGTSSSLRTDAGTDPDVESYLRFTVTGVVGAIQSARLRVYATTGTSNGPAVYATGSNWSETGITWNTRPARTSSAIDDRGAIATNAWFEYNVTPLITGDGTYSVILATDNSDGSTFSSRQGSFPPQLVLTFAGSSTAVPTATPTPTPTSTPRPSGIALPGRFEVEDYRSGGAGVGYVDSTSGNSGGVYRSDDVDIQSCADGTPCYNVAWITAGEWLAYDVAVASGGTYTIALRVATPNSGRQVHLEVDGVNVSGAMPLPNTGSWQSWTTVLSAPIPLSSGPHTLRIVADTGGFNLNSVSVTSP